MNQSNKELDFASQLSFEGGKWHFTFQSWIKTQKAANAAVKIIEIVMPLLAENDAVPVAEAETTATEGQGSCRARTASATLATAANSTLTDEEP